MNKTTILAPMIIIIIFFGINDMITQRKTRLNNLQLIESSDTIAEQEEQLKKLKLQLKTQEDLLKDYAIKISNQTEEISALSYHVESFYDNKVKDEKIKEELYNYDNKVDEKTKEELAKKDMDIWRLSVRAVRPWKRINRTAEDMDPPAGFPVFSGIPKDFWDKLARVYPVNELSPTQKLLPLCTNTNLMLNSGTINTSYVWGDWNPKTCRLEQAEQLKQCMQKTKVAIFGDSTGRALSHSLNNQIYHEREVYSDKTEGWGVGGAKTAGWVRYMTFLGPGRPQPTSLTYKTSINSAKSADVIVVSVGLWAMGRLAVSIDKFIRELYRDLLVLKQMMKTDTRLVIRTNLVVFKWMAFDASVNRCNSPQKQFLFNVAIKDVASCVGAELLDPSPFLEKWDNMTSLADGVHFGSKFEGELLMNHFCRSQNQLQWPSKPQCSILLSDGSLSEEKIQDYREVAIDTGVEYGCRGKIGK